MLRGLYRQYNLPYGNIEDVQKQYGGVRELAQHLATGRKPGGAPAVPEGTVTRADVTQVYLQNFGREPTEAELAQHVGKTGTEHLLKWAPQRKAEMEQEALQKEVLGEEDTGIIGTSDDPDQIAKDEAEAKKIEDDAKDTADLGAERDKLAIEAEIAQYKDALGIGGKPEVPSLYDDYEALRSKEGVPALEGRLNQLNKDIADTEAGLRMGMYDVEGKLKPMELIGTEQRELARQGQEQLDTLNRSKQTIIDELATKNAVISNMMNLTQQDYANASNSYNTAFNQNLQMLEIIKGEEADERDFAIANLNTVTTMLSEAGKSWGELDSSLQATISKLETKSGLPQGITEAIYDSADSLKDIKKCSLLR